MFFGGQGKKKSQLRKPIEAHKEAALVELNLQGNTPTFIIYKKMSPNPEYLSTKINKKNTYLLYEVTGFIQLRKTLEPCIPNTYEVAFIAVDPDKGGQGYGALLNGIAFLYGKKRNLGITSDHTVGTSQAARSFWNKVEQNSAYKKKKTQKGNDTFDYDGMKTPDDLEDDCDSGNDKNPATDHSWIFDNDLYKDEYLKLKLNHMKYLKKIQPHLEENYSIQQFKNDIEKAMYVESKMLFQAIYKG